jgi:glycine cleavage system H protein
MSPDDLLYTKEHEWVRVDGDKATIGITAHAQDELGDVVFVELPNVGDTVEANEPFGSVESVKAVSELFMPVSGEVIKINPGLEDAPELVNSDPYGKGWMIRITIRDPSEIEELLSAEDYDEYIALGEPGD